MNPMNRKEAAVTGGFLSVFSCVLCCLSGGKAVFHRDKKMVKTGKVC